MEFDAVLIAPRRDACVSAGLWPDRTINDDLDRCLRECPDQLALTAVQVESGDARSFTYREMAAMADRIAVGLYRLGVRRNDVVVAIYAHHARLRAHRRGHQSAHAHLS